MARKTRDEWQILGLYSGTWEEVTAEDSLKEARARLKEYRENEPGTPFQMVKKRVKIGQSTGEFNTVADIRDTTAVLKASRVQHVTGDGKRWPTLEAAIEHANEVHRRTGNIISVEKAKRQRRSNSAVLAEWEREHPGSVRDLDLSDISDAKLQQLINSTAPGAMRNSYLAEAGKRVAAQVQSERRDSQARHIQRDREDSAVRRSVSDRSNRSRELVAAVGFVPPFRVDVWEERDRTSIVLYDANDVAVAEWWDEDARSMFEDGFFEARRLAQSVIEYAKSVGIIK